MIRFNTNLMMRVVFILLMLVLSGESALGTRAQSGRLKDPKTKPKTGPIAEPNRPAPSQRAAPRTAPNPTESASDEIDTGDVVRISSNLVPIPASVVDARGHTVLSLKITDFELLVDGLHKPISDLTRSETPVRLAMLFDNSGSIDFAREFEKQAAIHFFRRVMRPVDQAAIYSIETDSYLVQPLTSDIRALEQTIASFGKPEGSTSLFDAMVDAASYLRPYSGRKVIVIVSDGVETTSRVDFETTMRQVLADDCQVFIVQTGLYEGVNVRALAAERRMEQFASQTGGAAFLPKSTSDLEAAFKQIAADLAQQYVLSYYEREQNREGHFHLIELRIKAQKDFRVRARRGFYSRKRSPLVSIERQ
ncbi:MAG: VWA domain-containing protein [Pyrinomonadaceae bacterium]